MFRDILNQFQISFLDIKAIERKVIERIDLSLLTQNLIYDFVRELAKKFNSQRFEDLDPYLNFIDNFYLYCLTSDFYCSSMSVICVLASLAYFISKAETDSIRILYGVFQITFRYGSMSTMKLCKYKSFILKKLGELGVRENDIMLLDTRMTTDIRCF